MAKFKKNSTGAEVEAHRWLAGNEDEITAFITNGGFAVTPADTTKGVLYGVSHDTLTGNMDGQIWFPITSGDWVVEFSQAGKPIFLAFTDDEMQGKSFTLIEEAPVEEENAD